MEMLQLLHVAAILCYNRPNFSPFEVGDKGSMYHQHFYISSLQTESGRITVLVLFRCLLNRCSIVCCTSLPSFAPRVFHCLANESSLVCFISLPLFAPRVLPCLLQQSSIKALTILSTLPERNSRWLWLWASAIYSLLHCLRDVSIGPRLYPDSLHHGHHVLQGFQPIFSFLMSALAVVRELLCIQNFATEISQFGIQSWNAPKQGRAELEAQVKIEANSHITRRN